MNPYRIKHIPTGLYYKPGKLNLSKKGKVYMDGSSVLSSAGSDSIIVSIRKCSKIHEATKDRIQWELARFMYGYMIAKLPITEFEKEEL